MKKTLLSLSAIVLAAFLQAQQFDPSKIFKAEIRSPDFGINCGLESQASQAFSFPSYGFPDDEQLKISMSSSLNVNGLFSYDQRYLTIRPEAGMFTFGNRAGGPFGNTGNDLKYKYTLDSGLTWDSLVIVKEGSNNFRYPSMVIFNPTGGNDPAEMFGVFSGPIHDGTNWTSQYSGSIRLNGDYRDVVYTQNPANTYLNHMNIGLNVTNSGHAHVASSRLNGNENDYTHDGWEILNGVFNSTENKFDWQLPYVKVQPALLEDGRIDASAIVWSIDGSTGYLLGTAVDADPDYCPYLVEWPVIYKTLDQGVSWEKLPPFDFTEIGIIWERLYGTRANWDLVIPRWYNKWVGGESQNGVTIDIHGNLHIFGVLRSTLSINPDSLNWFYSAEPYQMYDVFMTPGGGWNAIYVDTLMSTIVPSPGTYGIGWDHQTQMTRTPDGSKVFCVWTDTNPEPWGGGTIDNSLPDLKAIGYDVVNNVFTDVKNFTEEGTYWTDNYWMRVADMVFVDGDTYTLPITTSIPGATNENPLVHQYFKGITFTEADFIHVGKPKLAGGDRNEFIVSDVSPNPCSTTATVKVKLEKDSRLSLSVFDLVGKKVFEIPEFNAEQGTQFLTINASRLTPGIYICSVTVNNKEISKKMVVK